MKLVGECLKFGKCCFHPQTDWMCRLRLVIRKLGGRGELTFWFQFKIILLPGRRSPFQTSVSLSISRESWIGEDLWLTSASDSVVVTEDCGGLICQPLFHALWDSGRVLLSLSSWKITTCIAVFTRKTVAKCFPNQYLGECMLTSCRIRCLLILDGSGAKCFILLHAVETSLYFFSKQSNQIAGFELPFV